ncbi:hypothetical protein GCM10009430_08590 [Aquimarina litoralis]|uniref:Uncharacterized protein n=1 Tax=Aquimarina litoralis TaxID=584605 RepID=A0ABP3TRV6_9FLAO
MKNRFLVQLIVITFLIFSCNSDDDSTPNITEEEVGGDSISSVDTKLLDQIKKAGDLFMNSELWNGYNLKDYPLYLVHKNKEGKIDGGILINPQSNIDGAKKLNDQESAGLKAYRYDNDADRAYAAITDPDEGNGLYDFDFEIDGNGYYIQVYKDEEAIAGENIATYPGGFFDPSKEVIGSIDFIIHENFHTYQDSWNSNKNISKTKISDRNNRIPTEVLELKILLHQIFKDFPNGSFDQASLEKKLKQYLAIATALGVNNFEPITETMEGSARYIERMAVREIFPKRSNEPFIPGTVLEDDYGITNQETLSMVFDFALTYEIGASVCYALNVVDADALKRIENRENLLEIIRNKYNLNAQELAQYLEQSKNDTDWAAIQAKAQEFSQL